MSDHLYYMSVKGGGSGDVHSYFNPSGDPIEAFVSFSNIISDFEARILQELQKPHLAAKWILRRLPMGKGFTFFLEFAKSTNLRAHSLAELVAVIERVPSQSIKYHIERGDLERWLSQVLGDSGLAKAVAALSKKRLSEKLLQQNLFHIIETRLEKLRVVAGKDSV